MIIYKDQYGKPCSFDTMQDEAEKPKLLELVKAIVERLHVINDGSYSILDEESAKLSIRSSQVS